MTIYSAKKQLSPTEGTVPHNGAYGRQIASIYGPLWRYIPLNEYSRPTAPAREALRSGLTFFWRRLHPVSLAASGRRQKLDSMPSYLLNHAARAPDLQPITGALADALRSWQDPKEPWSNVTVILGAPGSYTDHLVTILARQNGWRLLGAPSIAEILSGGNAWLGNAASGKLVPLAIPRLGKCYLRHEQGLELVSRLFDWLQKTNRRCLIACDSWAWAFLVDALRLDVLLPTPLTLSPLTAPRLQFWLPSLAFTNKGRFVFRDAKNGHHIFPMADSYDECLEQNARPGQMEVYGEWIGGSHFLKQLAAYGRGLPQVIWSLWRECLQISADTDLDELRTKVGADEWYTVWVKPWSQLELPVVPSSMGTNESILLHTLLLHGGSSAELLGMLLPFSPNEIRSILHQLLDTGLVEARDEATWHVTMLGYPAVRQFLEHEGYRVDVF